MGRGRAKAKQTKVARQLKYNSGGIDINRLQQELGHADSPDIAPVEPVEPDDEYAAYVDPYADDEDEDEDDSPYGHR